MLIPAVCQPPSWWRTLTALIFELRWTASGPLFWGSASCRSHFIKDIGRTVPRNNFLRRLFIFIFIFYRNMFRPSLAIFRRNVQCLGKLPHYDGSVVLCRKSYFVYVLAILPSSILMWLWGIQTWIKSPLSKCDCEVSKLGSNHLYLNVTVRYPNLDQITSI
jgi:hypothetical protein